MCNRAERPVQPCFVCSRKVKGRRPSVARLVRSPGGERTRPGSNPWRCTCLVFSGFLRVKEPRGPTDHNGMTCSSLVFSVRVRDGQGRTRTGKSCVTCILSTRQGWPRVRDGQGRTRTGKSCG
ncbi:hypothetical protein PVAP13_7NG224517 [Panicum virgatum]|uniref:Uncharacterized protein n=1 Tax=Panicum virgatum TaxID=38727 RepID=A0A8T0Q354_PANVG|nr:hypothetical protein PVAP13_7NG224517 [Panicum virgatum]